MKKIFIIPYRDRLPHKEIFLSHMEKLLNDEKDYEIVFSHQYGGRVRRLDRRNTRPCR